MKGGYIMLTKQEVAQIKEADWLTVHSNTDSTYLSGAIIVNKYGAKAEIPIEIPIDGGWIENYGLHTEDKNVFGACVFHPDYLSAFKAIVKVGDIVRAQWIIGSQSDYTKRAMVEQNTCNLRIQRGHKIITVCVDNEVVPVNHEWRMVRPL